MKVRHLDVTGRAFTLYPLSDVHWPMHDCDKLKEWRRVVSGDKKAVVTLGGDLFDFARGKYRAHLKAYSVDTNSSSAVDSAAMSKVEDMAHFLRPIRDKIAGVCVGNHFWTFPNGRVSDQELALKLGVGDKFVGALGLLKINVGGRRTVKVALHHDAGKRGGTASADMLAFQSWSHTVDSDIYVAGHTHRQYAGIYQTKITIDDDLDRVTDKKLVFVRSGAFMKGYTQTALDPEAPFIPDYAEVAMLPPSVLGIISVGVEAGPTGKLFYTISQRTL